MALLELLLVLLLSSVALGWIARRFKFPYPIALVAGGAVMGLVPNLPQHTFDPNWCWLRCCRPSSIKQRC
jgi:monovalent cation/hydrogen antiporter